ncbi:MAG: ABC transporter ATP-binding protein [Cyanobacteria bacterium J06628_6]
MIEVDALSKNYGPTVAIQDVSFRVEPGEILGFLGPNGAGKTTTMRILSGYLPATSGTAQVAGCEVHTDSMAVRQRIGYLPESPPLYPDMTVEGFLYFVARIKGVPAGSREVQVDSAIQRCNLGEKRKVLIRKLSKGFRQRVGIAQAIVHDPPVIILDEPTVGLDPRQIIDVRNLIKKLAGQHTIILSTHILPEVSATCDRVAIINRGRIVATDTPENLRSQLAGQLGYVIEVQGELDQAKSVLAALDPVESVEVLPREDVADGHHRLQAVAVSGSDPGGAIATALVHANLGLYELTRSRVSLEDVFINLTMSDAVPSEATDETAAHTDPATELETLTKAANQASEKPLEPPKPDAPSTDAHSEETAHE